jgi:DNA-directed RNA polymerase II subunit RPB7
MFFLKEEEHVISLHPSHFGPSIKQYLRENLIRQVEGKHNGEYFTYCVLDNIEYSEGKVMPGSGNAEYRLHYRAIVWKPFKGEVVRSLRAWL